MLPFLPDPTLIILIDASVLILLILLIVFLRGIKIAKPDEAIIVTSRQKRGADPSDSNAGAAGGLRLAEIRAQADAEASADRDSRKSAAEAIEAEGLAECNRRIARELTAFRPTGCKESLT